MFLGLDWYCWGVFALLFVLSLPLKIKFMNRWSMKKNGKNTHRDKWGNEK